MPYLWSRLRDCIDSVRLRVYAVTLLIILLGVLLTTLSVLYRDWVVRRTVMHEADIVASAIDPARLEALNRGRVGSCELDRLRLGAELTNICEFKENYRALYLLGRNQEGEIVDYACSRGALSIDELAAKAECRSRLAAYQEPFRTQEPLVLSPQSGCTQSGLLVLMPITTSVTSELETAKLQKAREMAAAAGAFYRKYGKQALLEAVNTRSVPDFLQNDSYAFICDDEVRVLAHPFKPELIGKDLLEVADRPGGKYFRREIRELADGAGQGWVDYEYVNPVSGQLEPKNTYITRIDDIIIAVGAYKGAGRTAAVLGIELEPGTGAIR